LINLFSTGLVSDYDSAKEYIGASMLPAIFYEEDGKLKINNYAVYVLFFGLFGRVYYLEGFEQRQLSGELTPSSYTDRNMVASMNWIPVTKVALDQIKPGWTILCRVELFENSYLLDEKIINLFQKYFNYNQYFYISSVAGISTEPPELGFDIPAIPGLGFDIPIPPAVMGRRMTKGDAKRIFARDAERLESRQDLESPIAPVTHEGEHKHPPKKR